jgi:hypothetical protein
LPLSFHYFEFLTPNKLSEARIKEKDHLVTLSGEDIGDAGIAYLVDMGSTLHIK